MNANSIGTCQQNVEQLQSNKATQRSNNLLRTQRILLANAHL